MDKRVPDQAEGLRRLLAGGRARVISVTGGSPRAGATTTVLNLATALAEQGKDVLVIDECSGEGSISSTLGGVRCTGSFIEVARGELPLERAVLRHPLGFGVLAASRANREGCTPSQLAAMVDGCADIVLIDAQLGREGALSALALQAHDVMIVMRVAAQSITETYACLKRLHYAHAIAQFRVVVNHVQSIDDARTAFDNLAGVAGRYLSVALEAAGCIAADVRIVRALELSRCVVDAFPSTPAARGYRHLAAQLQYWPMRPAMSSRAPWPASATVTAAQHADQPSAQHA
ncbi:MULTISPECIES: MinD/ParA family protein [Paraburkholderia]|uniref:MinD/ParA family ATP-binding protein n=1 Tax=Paraburkholderia TaxID=1822464 RepID=UPI00225058B2|nr:MULTISPECIES: MinD/ParA family protein [Paraburkholderia]MCX4164759.1 MinD/ParA family protein [Paraburkholderia megapolitana]MDN7160252.1 MinD/ParA family protein [Paraburkholderia sp. CHISQ3]MDQ6497299.1 MinD/ParA family protein [Paraburkholderia megapolitana]